MEYRISAPYIVMIILTVWIMFYSATTSAIDNDNTLLPTTLLTTFYKLSGQYKDAPVLGKKLENFVDGLPPNEKIFLAQMLLDDKDFRVRSFSLMTLSKTQSVNDTAEMLSAIILKRKSDYFWPMVDHTNKWYAIPTEILVNRVIELVSIQTMKWDSNRRILFWSQFCQHTLAKTISQCKPTI